MQNNDMVINMIARDLASAAIRKVQNELKNTGDAAKSASSGTAAATDGFKQLDSAAGALAGGLQGLAGVIGLAGIAALGAQAVQAVADLAKLGAAVEQQTQALGMMASQAGTSGGAILAALREASNGTVSDMELMQSANRAMILGVADSAGEMARLMEVATARAKVMGMTTSQAFSDIVTGIGRGSPLILDNLGITVDLQAAYESYAGKLGIAASALDETQKKQALLNAVMVQSASIVAESANAPLNTAQNIDKANTAWSNFMANMGQGMTPYTNTFNQISASIGSTLADFVSQENELTWNLKQAQIELAAAMAVPFTPNALIRKLESDVRYYRDALNELRGETDQVTQAQLSGEIAGRQYGYSLDGMSQAARQAATDQQWLALAAQASAQAMQQSIAVSNQVRAKVGQAGSSMGAFTAGKSGGDAGLAKQQAVTDQLNKQVDAWYAQGYNAQQINDVLLPGMISQLNESERASYKVASGTAQISEAAREAEQAFDDMRSKVQGVLSGALNLGVGEDAIINSILPREDAVNETARRLAAIARDGFAGQEWLGAFANDVPAMWEVLRTAADPRVEAAKILRDFQDGLRPELLDKEKAKELVRRAILGDQEMSALASEIATELAQELGSAAPANVEALARQALGGAGGLLAGTGSQVGTISLAGAQVDETQAAGLGAQFKQSMLAGFLAAPGDFVTPIVTSIAEGMATMNLALPLTQTLMNSVSSGDVVNGLTLAGGWVASHMEAGFAANTPGQTMMAGVVEVFRDSADLIQESGSQAGRAWGDGFMAAVGTSVPDPLIGLLVSLVTPGVMAQFAQRGTLMGANP